MRQIIYILSIFSLCCFLLTSCKKGGIVASEKPKAGFTFVVRSLSRNTLATVSFTNTTISDSRTLYQWSLGNGRTSIAINPVNVPYTSGQHYVRLIATNSAGSDSIIKVVNIYSSRAEPPF